MSSQFVPLVPSHADGILRVVILGRKSKPNPQNENESIEASMNDAESFLKRVYNGPVKIIRLGEQISGMIVDRETIRQAEDLIAAGEADLILTEDIGRIFRNPRHQYAFVQDCVDANVRLIAVADRIDTADDDWETATTIATVRHGLVVTDSSRRVRRSAKFSFHKGGNVQRTRFGYRKLSKEEAATGQFGPIGLRIAKMAEMTPIIMDIRRKVAMIQEYRSYDAIAEELNEAGIRPIGKKVKKWTGRMVADLMSDPILCGWRLYRKVIHKRIYGTGKHDRQRNPKPETEYVPELAHMSQEEFDELQGWMRDRAARQCGRRGACHPRHRIPRANAITPAQHMCCGICTQEHYPCGVGQFTCQGSLKWAPNPCWNHVQVDGGLARDRVVRWVICQLDQFPGFRERVVDFAWEEFQRLLHRQHGSLDIWTKRIAALEKEESKLVAAIRQAEGIDKLVNELKEVHQQLQAARDEHEKALRSSEKPGTFLTREAVLERFEEAVLELARTSFRFADLLREILVRFDISPIQAIDSGLVRPRAYLTLAISVSQADDAPLAVKTVEGILDLFDPPLHFRHLADCVATRARLREAGKKGSLQQIADELGINRMTVKRALDVARRMEAEGLSEPYRELREPPTRASRWRSEGNPPRS